MRKQLPVSDSEVVSDATTSFHLFSLLLAHLVYLLDSLPLEHSDILYIFLPRAQPTLTATSSTATAIVQQLSFFFSEEERAGLGVDEEAGGRKRARGGTY